jgi:hypothetical protein
MTVSGPNIGIGDRIIFAQGAAAGKTTYINAKAALLTRVNQNSASFVFPQGMNLGQAVVQVHYVVNGIEYLTGLVPITIIAVPVVPVSPPPAVPGYGYGIAEGNLGYTPTVKKWVFFDPYDPNPATNRWVVPINPNEMTSPFPQRQVTSRFTTAIDGRVLLFEGSPKPADWTFKGAIFNASHYDLLRSWVYDRRRRIIITDHFGRDIACVLQNFNPTPKRAVTGSQGGENGRGMYWRHDYEVTALVIAVGRPTVVPTVAP